MAKIITTVNGKRIERISRFIKIRTDSYVTPRHSLFNYAEDCGDNNMSVTYFVFKGKKYARGQFLQSGTQSVACDYQWYDKDGKLQFLSGLNAEDSQNPLLIEVSESGEYVRVYREVVE